MPSTVPIYQSGSTEGQYPSVQPFSLGPPQNNSYSYRTVTPYRTATGGQGYQVGVQTVNRPDTYNLNTLLQEMTRSYNQGAGINEQRYADILGGYRDRYTSNMGRIDALGAAESERLNRSYQQQQGKTAQSAISRGLNNTTVLNSLQRGDKAEYDYARLNLADSINRQRLDYDSRLSDDVLKFMERRDDQYPSLQDIASIAMAIGLSGRGSAAMAGGGATSSQIPATPYGNFEPSTPSPYGTGSPLNSAGAWSPTRSGANSGSGGGGGGVRTSYDGLYSPISSNPVYRQPASGGSSVNYGSSMTPLQNNSLPPGQWSYPDSEYGSYARDLLYRPGQDFYGNSLPDWFGGTPFDSGPTGNSTSSVPSMPQGSVPAGAMNPPPINSPESLEKARKDLETNKKLYPNNQTFLDLLQQRIDEYEKLLKPQTNQQSNNMMWNPNTGKLEPNPEGEWISSPNLKSGIRGPDGRLYVHVDDYIRNSSLYV